MAAEHREGGTVRVDDHDGVAVLHLLGEHDLATVVALRALIERTVADARGVVVSLAMTDFLDFRITEALRGGDELLQVRGQRLVLHVATASIVQRVLMLSGLATDLPCTGSVETAIALASSREGEPPWSDA